MVMTSMNFTKKLDKYLLITNADNSLAELTTLYSVQNENFDELTYIHTSVIFQDGKRYHIMDIPKRIDVLKFLTDNFDLTIVDGNTEMNHVSIFDIINYFKESEV